MDGIRADAMAAQLANAGLSQGIVWYDACHDGLMAELRQRDGDVGLRATNVDGQGGALQQELISGG
jgi:hypothetical protein